VIRNVIFDWSGTLVDDLPAVWHASNHIFRRAGVPELTLEQFRTEFQLPFRGFYERYVSHVPLPELELWFQDHFAQVQDTVVALPHAQEFLEFCRSRGLRTFLLSAVHPRMYEIQQRTTGFGEYLQHPYLGVPDKREQIRILMTDHGLTPADTVFIGDMEHDVDAARHGGIPSIAVLTGYNRLEQLRRARPDLIVEHLGELRGLLERNDLRLHVPSVVPQRPIATVGGLVFRDDGRMLMVRTAKWSDRWGIPGGKIEWGEASEAALRREMWEETGLKVEDVRFVLVQDAIHPPEFYKDAHFLLLNYTCRVAGTPEVQLNDEAQEFRWVTMEEARRLPLNQPTQVLLDAVEQGVGAAPP
jgi:phosphoglycolate phosphatase-like HAD superfamily hydrolase/ADP-ribose pyrophosphatase YjhB (NUDIX family)